MGRKVVRWICVGLAVLVALAAILLICFDMSKRNEGGETQQPPVTQTDSAVPQDPEQPEAPAGQDADQPEQILEQTPEQTEEDAQPGVTDESTEDNQTVGEEPVEEETATEDQPSQEPNDLGWG